MKRILCSSIDVQEYYPEDSPVRSVKWRVFESILQSAAIYSAASLSLAVTAFVSPTIAFPALHSVFPSVIVSSFLRGYAAAHGSTDGLSRFTSPPAPRWCSGHRLPAHRSENLPQHACIRASPPLDDAAQRAVVPEPPVCGARRRTAKSVLDPLNPHHHPRLGLDDVRP